MSAPAGWYPTGEDARRTVVVGVGTVLAFAPLFVVFTDWQWLIEATGAALCVLLPAILLRLRSPARSAHLLPGLVLLVLYCSGLYLSQSALGGLVPGPQSWQQILDLREQAAEQIRDSTSPLGSTHALRLFVVSGLGVFAALVDWYAVVRRAPALAGVPLLALFTVSGAIAGKTVGWIPFTSAAAGFLVILSADSRINLLSWGRIIPRRQNEPTARTRLGLSGRRIGVVAVIVAVAIPAVLPGLSRNLLADAFHGKGNGSGNGTAISPFASLKGELNLGKPVTLAEVSVTPGTTPYFLRSKVLDEFTGSGWVASSAFRGQAVSPAALAGALPEGGHTTKYQATIKIAALNDVAPTLGAPQSFENLRTAWRFRTSDGTLGGTRTTKNETYSETVVAPTPTPAELAATTTPTGVPDSLLSLPSGLPTMVRQLVQSLINDASTPYGKALALYDYFRDPANGFTYSLSTKAGDSGSDLVDFLTGKAGFCQQYAGALGVMFRAAGIPARVVLGYTHAAPDKNGNFVVTSRDAHAWVEGYFTGIGWLPFNPTPLVGDNASRNVEVPYAQAPGATTSPTTGITATPTTGAPTTSGDGTDRNTPAAVGFTGQTTTPSHRLLPSWVLPLVVTVLVLLVLLAILPGLRLAARRSRVRAALATGRVEPLWEELQATAVDTGIAWSPSTTPRQVPTWLRHRGVGVGSAVESLAGQVEQERYAPAGAAGDAVPSTVALLERPADPVASAADISDSIGRVQIAARAMRATLPWPRRVSSRLVPASVLGRWRRPDRSIDT